MDVMGYRNSGELSDITVVVNGEEFHLHKFPLYVRSNYFKNLTSDNPNSNVTRIELKNFPGGARIFAIVADYCYNKDVNVNADNVVAVKCAAEYLEMTGGGIGRGGLATLADTVIYDLIYTSRNKREYSTSLYLLEKAGEYPALVEKCGLHTKLIDAFTDNLSYFVKSASIYDRLNSSPESIRNLQHTALNQDQIYKLNNLSLKWMNDLVKSGYRHSLSPAILSYIIQNYIDYNTNLNPHYNEEASRERSRNQSGPSSNENTDSNLNLIKMASDILKVENRLNEFSTDTSSKPSQLINIVSDINQKDSRPSNLITIAGDILENDSKKPSNLVSIAGDILQKDSSQSHPSNLVSIASEVLKKDDSSHPSNLVSIAGDILEKDSHPSNLVSIAGDILSQNDSKPSNLVSIASEVLLKDTSNSHPSNLVSIAGDILQKEPTPTQPPSNLVSIASDILDKDSSRPSNLIGIADEIYNPDKKPTSLIDIAGEVLKRDNQGSSNNWKEIEIKIERSPKSVGPVSGIRKREYKPRGPISDAEKLEIISSLAKTLFNLNFELQFPISWLLLYTNALHNLNADSNTKSIFNQWTWDALNNLKNNSHELSAIPPSVMIGLAQDISSKDQPNSNDTNKLIDLTDRYLTDLDNDNKLNADTFVKLASLIPKEKRNSFDNLTIVLLNLLAKDNHNINPNKQKELLSLIDFQKVNEKTLEACKNSQLIPPQYITEAALALCARLRKELDEAKLLARSLEIRNRPYASTYNTPSSYVPKYSSSSSVRHRSNEPRSVDNSSVNYAKTSKLSSYPTSSRASASYQYTNNLPSTRTYSNAASTSRPYSTLNSANKLNNYNSLSSSHLNTDHYLHHHYHHFLNQLDYADSIFDYIDTSAYHQCYADEPEYSECYVHNHSFHSKIF